MKANEKDYTFTIEGLTGTATFTVRKVNGQIICAKSVYIGPAFEIELEKCWEEVTTWAGERVSSLWICLFGECAEMACKGFVLMHKSPIYYPLRGKFTADGYIVDIDGSLQERLTAKELASLIGCTEEDVLFY